MVSEACPQRRCGRWTTEVVGASMDQTMSRGVEPFPQRTIIGGEPGPQFCLIEGSPWTLVLPLIVRRGSFRRALFQDDHFLRLSESLRRKPVEIDTARQPRRVERSRIGPRRFSLVDERCDFTAEEVMYD